MVAGNARISQLLPVHPRLQLPLLQVLALPAQVRLLLQHQRLAQLRLQPALAHQPVHQQQQQLNMTKILLNPPVGAPISNVQVLGKKYFVEKPFEVDSMIKFEDDRVADDLLKLFEFLLPFTVEEAKHYKDDQAKRSFKCDKCSFATTTQLALDTHVGKHTKEEQMDKELGIEVVGAIPVATTELSGQELIDKQAASEGLLGEGLVDEAPRVGARF